MRTAIEDLDTLLNYLKDHNTQKLISCTKSDLPFSDTELRELVSFLYNKDLVDAQLTYDDVFAKITDKGLKFLSKGGYTQKQQEPLQLTTIRQPDQYNIVKIALFASLTALVVSLVAVFRK